jgi:Domain of unknown function (DUF4337)
MSEIEVPIEKVQQDLEHAAHGHHGDESGANWITWSALLSAVLAVLAAVAALQAGHQVNEAMLNQMKASDTWSYFQAKGIKMNLAETRSQILEGLGKEPSADLKSKIEDYQKEKKELSEKAEHLEEMSEAHFHSHEIFATSVTFYQIAIAVTAIAVLAKRKKFLLVAMGFGGVGLFYLVQGFISLSSHAH